MLVLLAVAISVSLSVRLATACRQPARATRGRALLAVLAMLLFILVLGIQFVDAGTDPPGAYEFVLETAGASPSQKMGSGPDFLQIGNIADGCSDACFLRCQCEGQER